MTQDKGPTTYTDGQPPTTGTPRQPMVPPQEADGTQVQSEAPAVAPEKPSVKKTVKK